MTDSSTSFEEEEKPLWRVYYGNTLVCGIEYDPVIAIERLEESVRSKDETIITLSETVSELERKLMDALRDARDAHADALGAKAKENLLGAVVAEIRLRLRGANRLIHKLQKYGPEHTP